MYFKKKIKKIKILIVVWFFFVNLINVFMKFKKTNINCPRLFELKNKLYNKIYLLKIVICFK